MKLSILEALNISVTGFIVVLIILALLACIIVVLSKLVRTFEKVANKKSGKDLKQSDAGKNDTVSDAAPAAPSTSAPTGMVELYKTGEKTAATIMAIVSHESGIPLNRLDFKSIKLKDETKNWNGSQTSQHAFKRSGNIGVTTTQQMLQSEIDLKAKNIIQEFFDDINKQILLKVF